MSPINNRFARSVSVFWNEEAPRRLTSETADTKAFGFKLKIRRLENKSARSILAVIATLAFAIKADFACSDELGFPASALAEFGTLRPMLTTDRTPELGLQSDASKPEQKMMKYTGKCYARIDGHIRINGPCPVTWKAGEDASVNLRGGEKDGKPGKVWAASIFREGHKWRAHGNQLTRDDGVETDANQGEMKVTGQDLGEVRKHGSCWTNSRVRICEKES